MKQTNRTISFGEFVNHVKAALKRESGKNAEINVGLFQVITQKGRRK